jgi:ElaA protein
MLHFECKQFEELSLKELHDLFALRAEVFVVEQDCVYQDIDGKDTAALHIIGFDKSKKPVAYSRILRLGTHINHIQQSEELWWRRRIDHKILGMNW